MKSFITSLGVCPLTVIPVTPFVIFTGTVVVSFFVEILPVELSLISVE